MANDAENAAAVWVEIDALVPWGKNPRRNDSAIPMVVESIKRFGFAAPLVVRLDTREVIAGHTRLAAAKALQMERVPVRFMDLSEDEAHALALADNKLGEVADWDTELLTDVFAALENSGASLVGLGWTTEEIENLTGALVEPMEENPFEDLPTGEPEFCTMTFTLTPDQRDQVEAAIKKALALGGFGDTGNENKNGNALSRIAEAYRG